MRNALSTGWRLMWMALCDLLDLHDIVNVLRVVEVVCDVERGTKSRSWRLAKAAKAALTR